MEEDEENDILKSLKEKLIEEKIDENIDFKKRFYAHWRLLIDVELD